MTKVADLTPERLRAALAYDPDTGVFTWRNPASDKMRIGDIAGTLNHGRIQIRIDGRAYRAHRLAWLYVHGRWPKNEIDHVNGNPSDNRIVNLRDVIHVVNHQNRRKPMAHNLLGTLGVSRNPNGHKFRARVDHVHLGSFDTVEEAKRAYLEAKRRMHTGCTL